MFNERYDTDMKTISQVVANKELFYLNNDSHQFVKLGSVREGFYICLNLTTQQITEEQSNTVVCPIINIAGLKAY